ncbi:MAG: hypothetical protein Q8942_02385 [Bacillota bacterium]|nr:hypothetical protein [Bacillota bacterium]
MGNLKLYIVSIVLIVSLFMTSGCGKISRKNSNSANNTISNNTISNNSINTNDSKVDVQITSPWRTIYQNDIKRDFLKSGFFNERFGIATGFSGENFFTYDAGHNWISYKNESNNSNAFDICDEDTIWYGDDFGDIGLSVDGGKTWRNNKGVFMERVFYLSAIDKNTALFGNLSKIEFTKDGGKHLEDIKLPSGIDGIAAIFLKNPNEAYILDFKGSLYYSKDSFLSWEKTILKSASEEAKIRFDIGSSSSTASISAFGDKDIVVAYCQESNGIAVMRSKDEGDSWSKETVSGEYANNIYISKNAQFVTYNSSLSTINVMKYSK